MRFEDALRDQLERDPALSRRGRRILAILNDVPTVRRARKIARMENTVRSSLGVGATAAVEWAEIDWKPFIQQLLELLLKLLPLLF